MPTGKAGDVLRGTAGSSKPRARARQTLFPRWAFDFSHTSPAMQLVCPACSTKNRVPEARLSDEPVCGRCGAALMPAEPVALGDDRLPAYLAGTELPVVIDFWADWCGPCKMMAPHFAAAARTLPQVRFVKVDTEASPQAGMRHGIRSIPTVLLYRRGQEVARRSGAMPSAELVAWIRSHTG
jgi:thioredoxin 2